VNSATRELARFAVGRDAAVPPSSVRRRARMHLLDTLGAGLAGSTSPELTRALAAATRVAGTGAAGAPWAQVWGTPVSLPASDAARVNGIAAHAFELDDTRGCDHSGAVVVPAVLAAMALCDRPVGADTLADAVVAGYEVARRAQTALGGYDAVNARGWHSTGVCGPLGAAVAAARVLELDVEPTVHALGLAAGYAGGTWSFLGSGAMAKRLNVGRAAELGLQAAVLAEQGFTGPPDAMEATWGGYLQVHGGPTSAPGALTTGLGQDWQIEQAAIKPYAACRSTHAAVDGLLDAMREHGWGPADITAVTVETSRLIADMCGGRDLDSALAAQLSMPFAMATVALTGGVRLSDVTAARRSAPQVAEMMDRITLRIDPDRSGGAAAPTLHIDVAGRRHSVTVHSARGGPDRPLSDSELLTKFRQLVGLRMASAAAEALIENVLNPGPGLDMRALSDHLSTAEMPDEFR
jgi:2-methylcitrate dehydratase PrpD